MDTKHDYRTAVKTASIACALAVLLGCAHESGPAIAVKVSTRDLDHVEHGMTLLDRAAEKGDLYTVKSLVKAGALIEPSADQKATGERQGREDSALIFAARSENPKVVAFLLERGANVNFKGALGFTALMRACEYKRGAPTTQDIYRQDIFIPLNPAEQRRSDQQRLKIVRM